MEYCRQKEKSSSFVWSFVELLVRDRLEYRTPFEAYDEKREEKKGSCISLHAATEGKSLLM